MGNCRCRCVGAVSSKGDKGNTGATGEQGLFGGYSSSWLFDSSNTTTPAVDYMSTNNSDETLVTMLYISPLNINTVDLTAFLGSFTNAGYFGKIRLFKAQDSNSFFYYEITGVTLNGGTGIYEIGVTYIDGNPTSPLINLDSIVISFTPNPPNGSSLTTTEFIYPRSGADAEIYNITNVASYIAPIFGGIAMAPATGSFDVSIIPSFQALGPDPRVFINYAIAVNGAVPDANGYTIASGENPYGHSFDFVGGNAAATYGVVSSPQITRRLDLTMGDTIELYALDFLGLNNTRVIGMVVTLTQVG